MVNQRKRSKTKNRIKEVFRELFEENGFQKITVSAVCEKSGVNRWTFYNYYENLDALLLEIEEDLLEETRQKCELLTRQKEEVKDSGSDSEPLVSFLLFYKDNKSYMVHFLSEDGDPFFINHTKALWGKSLGRTPGKNSAKILPRAGQAGPAALYMRERAGEKYIMKYTVSAVLEIVHDWLLNDDLSAEELAQFLKKLIWV